jgi:hypothetical protein
MVFRELQTVAMPLWTERTLGHAQALFVDALAARDCSSVTRTLIRSVAFVWLQAGAPNPGDPHLTAGVETLRSLVANAGQISLPPLHRLPRGSEHHVIAALRPYIEASHRLESYRLVLSLCTALGDRAHGSDFLQRLLEDAVFSDIVWVAKAAVEAWLGDRNTRDGRVRILLDRDASFIVHPVVFKHLHYRRQEWLDPFLAADAISGVFLTGRTVRLPMVTGGFERWLPRQQQAYAGFLTSIAGDVDHPVTTRARMISALARIPCVTLQALHPWVGAGDVTLQEAALGALVWTSAPGDAVPELVKHLDGDRARVAMYALQRGACFMDGPALPTTLHAVLDSARKVTVVKEVLRLYGRFRVPGTTATLCAVLTDSERHRDIRIAALSGLRDFVDVPGAFEAAGAVTGAAPDLARALLISPASLGPRHRARWFALVQRLFDHDDLAVRQAVMAAGTQWFPYFPSEVAESAAGLVTDLSSGSEWSVAKTVLVAAARDGLAHDELRGAVAALIDAVEPADGELDRDLPARQRRQALVWEVAITPTHGRVRVRGLLNDLAHLLEADQASWPMALAARASAIDMDDPGAEVLALAEELQTHPDRASHWTAVVSGQLAATPQLLAGLSTMFSASELWLARLLAVSLLPRAAAYDGWSEARRATLRLLRSDRDDRVRTAALQVFTSVE